MPRAGVHVNGPRPLTVQYTVQRLSAFCPPWGYTWRRCGGTEYRASNRVLQYCVINAGWTELLATVVKWPVVKSQSEP